MTETLRPSLTVVYVITSDESHAYADMALISILSVRLTNPGWPVAVVCDERSANSIKRAEHPLARQCDQFISVDTPDGDPIFRSRWIKTQLCRFVEGNVLYLDADTLVRGPLTSLPDLVFEFGAVPNHNGTTLGDQIWEEDLKIVRSMGWPEGFKTFVNGGVWFFRPFDRVRRLFAQWHAYWLEAIATRDCARDQPSLNSAILKIGAHLTVLPGTYNAQVAMPCGNIQAALVWHFYASAEQGRGALGVLIHSAKNDSLDELRLNVSRAIGNSEPSGSSMRS